MTGGQRRSLKQIIQRDMMSRRRRVYPLVMPRKMGEMLMRRDAAEEAEVPLAILAFREVGPKGGFQLVQRFIAIKGPQFLCVMVAREPVASMERAVLTSE